MKIECFAPASTANAFHKCFFLSLLVPKKKNENENVHFIKPSDNFLFRSNSGEKRMKNGGEKERFLNVSQSIRT
jgi:hypothetical protein